MGIGERINIDGNRTSNVSEEKNVLNKQKLNSIDNDKSTQKIEIVFSPENAKYAFDDIILQDYTFRKIKDTLAIREKQDLVFEKWGLKNTHKDSQKVGINLYGPPGTGKTLVAHAIAHYLQKKILVVNYADIESKFVGETPKNLKKVFETAVQTDSILFFDEADAMLSRRVTNMNNATDTSVNQTRSVLLTLLNDYQGIVIFATNYISNYDPAFMRRILAHIEFELPNEDMRKLIYKKLIPFQLPNNININEVAKKYEGLSGSDISNAILIAAFKGAQTAEQFVNQNLLEEALEDIKKSQQANENQSEIKVKKREVSEEYALKQLNKS